MDDPPVDESRRVLILSRGLSSSPLFHQSSLNSNAEFQRSNSNVSENIDQLISDRLFAAHQRLKKLSTLRQSILASMAMQNHNRSRKILRKRTISTPTLGSAELLQQAKEFTLRRKSAIVTTKTMPVAAETSTMLASAWSKMVSLSIKLFRLFETPLFQFSFCSDVHTPRSRATHYPDELWYACPVYRDSGGINRCRSNMF
jgi:hypothetical protein